MSYLTLAEAKEHLAVVHDADDQLIEALIEAAESHAASIMGRAAITDSQECPWIGGNDCCSSSEQPIAVVPAAVLQAIKMLVWEFYENRGQFVTGVSVSENPTVMRLLHFHRVGLGV